MVARTRRAWALAAAVAVAVGVSVEAVASVGLVTLSPHKETRPGGFVTHAFSLSHTGGAPGTYDLTVGIPDEWTAFGIPPSVDLGPGGNETLFVTIVVPFEAPEGAYTVELTAVSTTDPAATASASARVEVDIPGAVEIVAPPEGGAVCPGEEGTYEFVVANRGSAQDVLAISAESSCGFPVEACPATVELAPQERRTIAVRVGVPPTAEPGHDVLTVTAISTLYAGVSAEAVVFTAILSPSPSAAGGPLYELLAGQLRLQVGRDEINDAFESGLSFSGFAPVLGGTLSASVGATSPFGPDPFDVATYLILYHLGPAWFGVGRVSTTLTDFLAATCEGAYVSVDTSYIDLSLLAGIDDDKARFSGGVAAGPETTYVGIAYSDARNETEQESIWSGTAFAEPLPDWTLRVEAGVGTDDGLLGHAFLFNTTLDADGYFLSGSAFSVETYFPGLRRDSAGIEIAQRLRLRALSVGVSLAHVRDNVVDDPSVETAIEDTLGFNLYALPITYGPEVRTTLEFERARGEDPAVQDDVGLLLAYGLTQSGGVFPYAFDGRVVDRLDRVTGSHVRTLAHGQGVGLSLDAFYIFLRLQQEKYVDVTTGTTLRATSNASLALRPEGTLHEASIVFQSGVDDYDLATSLFVRISESLDVLFSAAVAWTRDGLDPPSFGWGIALRASFDLPVPFLVTKGRLGGRLFIDRNGDGAYNEGDTPVGGAVLIAEGCPTSTDAAGCFDFPPLPPGTYRVTVSELPADAAAAGPIDVAVVAGDRVTMQVPVSPVGALRGSVYEDVDQDGKRQSTEGGLPGIRLTLTGPGETASATSDARGDFAFYGLAPGIYILSIDVRSLPPGFSFTTPEVRQVRVTTSDAPPIALGGHFPPQEVVVISLAPTANFTHTPAAPAVGETVVFDASSSSDVGGSIVDYVWDFDGDAMVDARGSSVVRTFDVAGRAEVALTVTDDAGNTATKTLSLEVRNGADAALPVVRSFQPPVADFAYSPIAPTPGIPVGFDGSASRDFDGQIVNYAWDFDADGRTDATGPAAVWVFRASGVYSVSLTVTDDGGNHDTASYVVEVAAPLTPSEPTPTSPETQGPIAPQETQASPPTAVSSTQPPIADIEFMPLAPTAGEPVTFSGEPSVDLDGTIVGYEWDFNSDGVADSTDLVTVYVFSMPGTFGVRLTVTDDGGNTDTLVVEIEIR